MTTYLQAERSLSITTPLGDDVLLLTGFSGREEMSRLFRYQLELLSEDDGDRRRRTSSARRSTWTVRHVHSEPRHFHGFVSRFAAGAPGDRGLRTYRAEVVPWLWFLTRTADCRIFQNKTAPDIIKEVFDGLRLHGLPTVELQGLLPQAGVLRPVPRDGVQLRLAADGGGGHLLLLPARGRQAHAGPGRRKARLRRLRREAGSTYSPGARWPPNHITAWEHQLRVPLRQVRPRPTTTSRRPAPTCWPTTDDAVDLPGIDKYELFDYPGEYGVKGDGEPLTKVRMEEEEAGYDVVQRRRASAAPSPPAASSRSRTTTATRRTGELRHHRVQHAASEASYAGTTATASSYSNTFTCIPAAVHLPPAAARRPSRWSQGPQTAVVVGPPGRGDLHRQVRPGEGPVPLGPRGKKDENSSCWIRVAEIVGRQELGDRSSYPAHRPGGRRRLPRGRPRPAALTGRVYNAEQMPAYALPRDKMISGLSSNTYPGGGGNNEITLNDRADAQELLIHAEKDLRTTVRNDRITAIGHDSTEEIANNSTHKVKLNETIDIGQNLLIKAGTLITLECGASRIHMNQAGVIKIEGVLVTMTATINTNIGAPITNVAVRC